MQYLILLVKFKHFDVKNSELKALDKKRFRRGHMLVQECHRKIQQIQLFVNIKEHSFEGRQFVLQQRSLQTNSQNENYCYNLKKRPGKTRYKIFAELFCVPNLRIVTKSFFYYSFQIQSCTKIILKVNRF